MSDSIKVAIKVRPLIKREKDDNLAIQWTVQGNSIVSTDPEMKKRGDGGFCFDHIFDMNTSNSNIFDIIVKPIVNAAVNGFNGTVFAYGQTSSGKTYTMMGTMEEPGIIPLAVEHMFDAIANTAGREFLLRVSYLEIYNERVNDLLNKTGIDLKLKEDGTGQVVVQCKEEITNSPENVLAIMKKGDKNRRIGETNMNERSSRSHTIFRITIESREAGTNSDGAIQVSQLNLVDLAGSERARQTGATGERFKEGRHINMSLSTLGLVIMQLSESQDGQKHVNFRDSKLTRLLQTSLGGNAMTAIICAVTPAALEETQCTLSFASRAKSVKNKPQVNEVMSDAALLKRYAKQLTKLQKELEKVKNENRFAEMEEMESKLQEKDRINQLLEERIELLKTRIVSGDITSQGQSFKWKSKRRQTWGGPGMFNQHLPVFQPKTGLPTIKEVSFEKPDRRSIIQSLEMMNQTFQTEFADFELELFESERARESKGDASDSDEEPFITKRKHRVTFKDDIVAIKSRNNSFETTPEKCDTYTQTNGNQISPSTPKQVLRQRITDLTKEFVELREFTTLEKQLICQENHCAAREEAQILPAIENLDKERISGARRRLADLDLADETDANRIIVELCLKLNEAEKQNSSMMERCTELEKRMENTVSERNEFEYIGRELRAELKKKTMELELKGMSEETVRQEESRKISELENRIESIVAEKNQLERGNVELRAELSRKSAELLKQTENIVAERNEFEHIRRELYKELDKKSLELEKLRNDSRVTSTEDRTVELEKEIESTKSERDRFERTNAELESKVNSELIEKQKAIEKVFQLEKDQIESKARITDLESKLLSEQVVNRETTNKVSELEEEIERVKRINTELNENVIKQQTERISELEKEIGSTVLEKNQLERVNAELRSELTQKISALETKELENQETTTKISELEERIESMALKNDELERVAAELRTELENRKAMEKISELNSQLAEKDENKLSPDTENQETVVKICKLEEQIESMVVKNDELERVAADLRRELNEKISELEANKLSRETENQETVAKICKLGEQIESMVVKNDELERVAAELRRELNEKISELETNKLSPETENQETVAKICKLEEQLNAKIISEEDQNRKISEFQKEITSLTTEKNELERVNDELRDKLSDQASKIKKRSALKDAKDTELMEMICELEEEIENITSTKNELELGNIELRAELGKAMETILELNEQIAYSQSPQNRVAESESNAEYDLKDSRAEDQESRDQLENQSMLSCSKVNESHADVSALIVNMEAEKNELEETLVLKSRELEDIRNDVQGLRTDIKSLQDTIYLLTTENMEMAGKLATEQENGKRTVHDLQKTIDELYGRISEVTSEKIRLESDLASLNDQLESMRCKVAEAEDDGRFAAYQSRIEKLTAENIELSTCVAERNKELQSIKEKSNKCLRAENDELSTDLIDKIEENDALKEQCDVLKNKTEQLLAMNGDLAETGLERLKTENNTLRAEIAGLKAKLTILSDENARFSNNLLETIEDLDSSCKEKSCNDTLHLSTIFENGLEIVGDSPEMLRTKVTVLQNEIDRLTRLNKKLGDLKLTSCGQCAHLRNLNESRRALKLEAKALNQKLQDLQRKFDRKCEDAEILKRKIDDDLNTSENHVSLNASFVNEMDVSFVEEKIRNLNDELQTLRTDHDKLSILYEDKCDELKKLQIGIIDNVDTDGNTVARKDSNRNENRMCEIQNYVDRLKEDVDEMKRNSVNFTATINQFKAERADLMDEIGRLKEFNEDLRRKLANDESAAASKVQILETELNNMSREVERYSVREKELERERLTLEIELENLRIEEGNKNALIARLNERVSCLTRSLETEPIDSNIIKEKEEEVERRTASKIKDMEVYINNLQANLTSQESLYTELQKRTFHLEQLLQENEQAKRVLLEKLQAAEIEATDHKNKLETQYRITLEYQQRLEESQTNLQQLNDTLNKYVDENLKLTEELGSLQGIKQKFDEVVNEKEQAFRDRDNLKDELDDIKKCMIKELKSLECNVSAVDILDKPINEIFVGLLQTLVSKEEEVIKRIRESCERDKRRFEDEKQQCVDTEKRTVLWAKELEAEIEKLHSDIVERERVQKVGEDKIAQLEHLLKESSHEKEMLKEKVEALEADFNNLQTEFDKQCRIDSQQEEAMMVARKREKEVEKTFRYKELELQTRMKTEKDLYEKRINELVYTVESYKTKNLELNGNIEGLEANEKQLRNIIEANSIEIKRNNQSIDRMNAELEQVTLAYNRLNEEMDRKNLHVEEMTGILKSKCDMLSEYKTKLETVLPEYEMLKEHVKDQGSIIQRHKEELETMRMEREEQLRIVEDKLNSEEIKSAGLSKQLNELNNRNIRLMEELNELKERYEELQEANAKLERKIRNSTSKIRAETEIEELKEANRRLQNNLEGAGNRAVELQEAKNQMLKELVELKGKYEFALQENAEMKTMLSQKCSGSTMNESRYDALLLEKNKIALELEGNKVILNRKDEESKRYANQVQRLTKENKELDKELDEYAATIRERDTEISKLEDKLYEAEQKLKRVNEENEKLKCRMDKDGELNGARSWKETSRSNLDVEYEEKNKLMNELAAQKLILNQKDHELKEYVRKIQDLTKKLEDSLRLHSADSDRVNVLKEKVESYKVENKRLKSEIEEFEMKLRMSAYNEGVTLRKDNAKQKLRTTIDNNLSGQEDKYQRLKDKIRELELQIVSKNGKIATLEIQIQSENFPYQRKCKELEERVLAFHNKNAELNSEIKKLQRALNDVNAWECDICRRWRVNRKDQACQTIPNNTIRFCSSNSGVVEDHVKIQKLLREKEYMKDLCRSRSRRIKELEDRIKELEVTGSLVSKTN